MLMVDISGKSRFLTVADPDDDTIHTVFIKQANDLSHHRPSPPPDPVPPHHGFSMHRLQTKSISTKSRYLIPPNHLKRMHSLMSQFH
jgi:hypothetical protein